MSDAHSSPPVFGGRLTPGMRLNGIFEIDGYIASGGMGEIYRGHAIETGDLVAIKVMRTDLADNDTALALFRKEASALHYVHHDAIVHYYVFSLDPDTRRHYLAMEFVDGEPLSEILKRGPLSPDAVHQLQERLAAGLDAAHRHGVVHRDLSPDNILIPSGDVRLAKIIDFGIARTAKGDGTIIGSGFAGKFNYVSPEQLGLFGGNVTAKSDIYSLGLVLTECLCGRPLDMGGSQVDVVDKRRVLPDLSAVDARFRPLINLMLQPDPKGRPDSMAVVATWQPETKPQATSRSGQAAAASSLKRGKMRLAVGVAAAVVVLCLGGAGIYFFNGGTMPQLPWLGPGIRGDGQSDELARRRREEQEERRRLQESQRITAPNAKPGAGGLASTERPPTDLKERITNFVSVYDGGDCFFVAPVAIAAGKATLEGYARSPAPFEVLDYEFKRSQGFEASVGYHTVTDKQCSAINFVARLRHQRRPAPNLDVSAGSLRSDGFFSGSISELGGQNVELLMVDHDGIVQSLTRLLKGTGTARSFTVNIRRDDIGPPKLQLLLAILSAKPLDALKPPRSGVGEIGSSDEVFSRAFDEAQRSGQALSVSIKSFNLEK